eukprot:m.143676 g.143676  ORF g.143676 m.143676 type:complete len:100 (+) comp52647_c0_seq38:572-871(+)
MIILFFRLLLLLCMILLRLSSCRFYRAIIEDVQIMTIVREPLSHALSWLTYTQAVNDMNTLVRLIPTNSLPENPMALGSSPSSLLESASTSVFAVKRTS